MNLVTVPVKILLDAAAGLGVIGGDQAHRTLWPVFWVSVPHLALDLLEALDPDVPQRLHLLQRPQTFRRSDRPDSLEQARPSSRGSPSRSACL